MKKTAIIRESRRGFLRRTRLYVVTEPGHTADPIPVDRHSAYADTQASVMDYPRRAVHAHAETAVAGTEESPAVRRR